MILGRARIAYAVVVLVVSLGVMTGINSYYTNKRIITNNEQLVAQLAEQRARSDRRFCELLGMSVRVDPRNGPKPSTPRGVDQQKKDIEGYEATKRLIASLGCPK